mmetsp:Transcript_41807/g.115209  ORF Transcript_41807/g.115209 Transcript_41807/m.115209 type:complete len:312 (-) Transcript_41807:269-1204(-)
MATVKHGEAAEIVLFHILAANDEAGPKPMAPHVCVIADRAAIVRDLLHAALLRVPILEVDAERSHAAAASAGTTELAESAQRTIRWRSLWPGDRPQSLCRRRCCAGRRVRGLHNRQHVVLLEGACHEVVWEFGVGEVVEAACYVAEVPVPKGAIAPIDWPFNPSAARRLQAQRFARREFRVGFRMDSPITTLHVEVPNTSRTFARAPRGNLCRGLWRAFSMCGGRENSRRRRMCTKLWIEDVAKKIVRPEVVCATWSTGRGPTTDAILCTGARRQHGADVRAAHVFASALCVAGREPRARTRSLGLHVGDV